ncbi:MAG: 4-(cytidine 5'-diphospho)-2-C-methyl-D-erythritol kinase [Clostridiales bacterium]|nr:4-(cytidine 5'-diphospho)-2-C-methyl-D-erythritol kinase [Clostridiales bacterium]
MREKAYAKINISLDVIGKREDNYHLLKMIMQTIDVYDEVEVKKANEGINLRCNKKFVPNDERNLAYKAAKLMMEKYKINGGVYINIKKNIPVSAGLAGGSTDGAAVLRIMNNLFNINATNQELRELGLKLGADVPFCIEGGTALCEGIGEKITQLKPFKNHILVLVKPAFAVSTKEVYKKYDISKVRKHPKTFDLIKAIEKNDFYYVAKNMKNLLENVTLKEYEILINIKEQIKEFGAINSMMSGSGPSVYGFFDDMLKAKECYDEMKKVYRDVFITRTI